MRRVHRVVVAHVTDFDVHGPIRTDEHVARGAFHHIIHHFFSPECRPDPNTRPASVHRELFAAKIAENSNDTTEYSGVSLSLSRTVCLCLALFLSRSKLFSVCEIAGFLFSVDEPIFCPFSLLCFSGMEADLTGQSRDATYQKFGASHA